MRKTARKSATTRTARLNIIFAKMIVLWNISPIAAIRQSMAVKFANSAKRKLARIAKDTAAAKLACLTVPAGETVLLILLAATGSSMTAKPAIMATAKTARSARPPTTAPAITAVMTAV